MRYIGAPELVVVFVYLGFLAFSVVVPIIVLVKVIQTSSEVRAMRGMLEEIRARLNRA